MSFVCKRCKLESSSITKRELICESCYDDLELLEEQQKVNNNRIKKLEEHKKQVEPKTRDLDSSFEEKKILFETMKRLEKNLKIEYELQKGILKAIESKEEQF